MNLNQSGSGWRDDQKRIILSDIERIKNLRQYVQACEVRLTKFKKLEHYYKEEIKREESYLHQAKKEIHRLEQALTEKTFH
jgi:hypothetical protein